MDLTRERRMLLSRLGIVAWAQLESRGLDAELDRLSGLPGGRGVRRTCQIEIGPAFCCQTDYLGAPSDLVGHGTARVRDSAR